MWRSFNYFTCLRTQITLSLTRCKYKGLKSLRKECRKNYSIFPSCRKKLFMETSLFSRRFIPEYRINPDITTRHALRSRLTCLALKRRAMFTFCNSYLRGIRMNMYDIRVARISAPLFGVSGILRSDSPRYYRYR